MASYNIEYIDKDSLYCENQNVLKREFKDYYLENHFKIGTYRDKDMLEIEHALIMSRILSLDNCTIMNYVQDKLEGVLDQDHYEEYAPNKEKDTNWYKPHFPETIETKMFWTEVTW